MGTPNIALVHTMGDCSTTGAVIRSIYHVIEVAPDAFTSKVTPPQVSPPGGTYSQLIVYLASPVTGASVSQHHAALASNETGRDCIPIIAAVIGFNLRTPRAAKGITHDLQVTALSVASDGGTNLSRLPENRSVGADVSLQAEHPGLVEASHQGPWLLRTSRRLVWETNTLKLPVLTLQGIRNVALLNPQSYSERSRSVVYTTS